MSTVVRSISSLRVFVFMFQLEVLKQYIGKLYICKILKIVDINLQFQD